MRVLGVIDLLGGRAVHASGGDRERYAPVQESGGVRIDGDAKVLARAYVERFGLREVYVADLDAIRGGEPQRDLVGSLVALGSPVWLDAGVSSAGAARAAIDLGVSRVIVGLETLSSLDALADICQVVGTARVAFSLDLRDGVPVCRLESPSSSPEELASRAASAGAGAIVILDLGRVGSGAGIDTSLVRRIRNDVPHVTLLTGGGLRNALDIDPLVNAGCDGVLVATALHTGAIGPRDLARFTTTVSP